MWKESGMRSLIAIFTVAAVLAASNLTEAAGPRQVRVGAYNKQAAIGASGRAMYPRYYWGFHAREFQNIGMPPGDIGMLGSGIQRNPW
jgi:hypothetical protein